MTEEEARKKWCPYHWANNFKDMIPGTGKNYPHCIASDCMMWVWDADRRWDDQPEERDRKTGRCGLTKT